MPNKASFLLLGLMLLGCSGMNKTIAESFRDIAEEDLSVVVEEIRTSSPASLLKKPYYRIVEYSVHKESRLFTHKAVVEFFYLDSIMVKQIRKYRYQPSTRLWDRYHKKIHYVFDK